MTPQEIETAARQRLNAISDNFWSQQEIFDLIYEAELEFCRETMAVEQRYSTSTVAGTQEYAYPTYMIGIKRIMYNGQKLKKINLRQDDILTMNDFASTEQGTPVFYFIFDETVFLRPVPDAVGTLQIWGSIEPTPITAAAQVIEVHEQWHRGLSIYVAAQMFAKDQNWNQFDRYMSMWNKFLMDAKRYTARQKRTDAFAVVNAEEDGPITILGPV